MAGKIAAYDTPRTKEVVAQWFEEKHDNEFRLDDRLATIADLFQSFHEYTTPIVYTYERMDVSTFAKCLVACKIIDVGGWWVYRPDYTPLRYEITRATA